jgi:3-methyladenine DNA glycosylase AlkD
VDWQQRNQKVKMNGQKLRDELLNRMEGLKEEEYKNFSANLIPGIDRDKMLGVRIPTLRKLASELLKGDQADLRQYLEILSSANLGDFIYEEKLLWGILLAKAKMTDKERMAGYQDFVPVIDNWAVCDIACATLPTIKKNPEPWMDFFLSYVRRDQEFEIRFGVVMLLANFIDEDHIDTVLLELSNIKHSAYYVTMAVGWTLSACFVRFPEKTETLLAEGVLTKDIQNKTIQKIRESNSVSKQDKEHMKGYKRI